MRRLVRSVCAALALILVTTAVPVRAGPPPEHPFILWTADEVRKRRARLRETDWAKASLGRLRDGRGEPVARLLRAVLEEDAKALAAEKKRLLGTARSPVPRGAAQWMNVLRYDFLYDRLSAGERREVETFFRRYIDLQLFKRAILDPKIFNDERNFSRYDAKRYTRSNWLPNIIWPFKVSANLMAVALGDEALVRKAWGAYGSWKWYFDAYLGDVGFYEEEFSKMGSTPGAMILYCRGLERLGLGDLGYGYTGEGGATMRGHIESLIHLTYPQVDLQSDRPRYPMMTMGDLRQSGSSAAADLPTPAFQHALVEGYLPDGTGGNTRWRAHGAWGGERRGTSPQWDGYSGFTPKMQIPLWFEAGHARWPDAGFDVFLAAMRAPDRETYLPSLLFGLGPIGRGSTKPPPAPSGVWPDRGIVLLRAEEGPDYWHSPAPAVGMRLAANYAHHVNDSFALLGLFAFNRPIYLNRQSYPGYAQGWSRSVQSHSGVKVDKEEPRFTSAVETRHAFTPAAKFVAARSGEVYPGVDLARGLVLAREYLLDVTRLAADGPRGCYWFCHALGLARGTEGGAWKRRDFPKHLEPLEQSRAMEAGGDGWAVRVEQVCALDDPSKAALPREWYERKIGVVVRMLGEDGTTVYVARTPDPMTRYRDEDGKRQTRPVPSEVGGETILAARRAPRTTFVALHEPFEEGKPRIDAFRSIGSSDGAVGAAIVGRDGSGIDDRVLVRLGEDHAEPVTLESGGERFTFAGWAWVRVRTDEVAAWGRVRAMTVRVRGRPRLVLNGKPAPARVSDGRLVYPAGN
ncbi:MAG: hypothetical protein R6X20_07950 [Phycisphaerae bacterium]